MSENSLLHRTTGFTWNGLRAAFKRALNVNHYLSIPAFFDTLGLPDPTEENRETGEYPFAIKQDLLDMHGVVHKFVNNYLDVYYPTPESFESDVHVQRFMEGVLGELDAINTARASPHVRRLQLKSREDVAELLESFILYVTCLHHHVGNVAEYLTDASVATAKLRPGQNIADVQASFQALLVSFLTGRTQPKLMDDFSHLLVQDEHFSAANEVLDQFQQDLTRLADVIKVRNEKRKYTTNAIDPREQLSSVSI